MKPAAIGLNMHSGWGVLAAISSEGHSIELLHRRRIVVTDASIPGASQPYHYAAKLTAAEGELYLANCAAASERLAFLAVQDVIRNLEQRDYRVAGCAVLLASGRPLPPLARILASHPLIHTAEGEFFRNAASKACHRLEIPVTAIREKELEGHAKKALGKLATRVQSMISGLGRSVGPPWTKDHKNAALAAAIVVALS